MQKHDIDGFNVSNIYFKKFILFFPKHNANRKEKVSVC